MIAALFCLMCCALLGGCGVQPLQSGDVLSQQLFCENRPQSRSDMRVGLYISYLDLANMQPQTAQQAKAFAASVAANALSIGCTDVFLQLRAFGDALYNSEVYPSMQQTVLPAFSPESDFARCLLETLHAADIRVHAWLNPYRLYPHADTEALYGFAAQYTVSWQQGLYLRPDSEQAKQLVLQGVQEVLQLGFDGVHFDDYFYPTTDADFDAEAYAAYLQAGGALALAEWRTQAVSDLMARCYETVKGYGNDKIFSLSPDGSVERNLSVHCADVVSWCSQQGYLDIVCPQLYYGFENESMPFAQVLAQWQTLCSTAELMPVLSAYKIASADSWAGSGSGEWQQRNDILGRQYALAAQSGCAGVSFYRYDSLFHPDETVAQAVMQELTLLTEEMA